MRDPLAEPSDLIRSVSRALRVLESVGRAPEGADRQADRPALRADRGHHLPPGPHPRLRGLRDPSGGRHVHRRAGDRRPVPRAGHRVPGAGRRSGSALRRAAVDTGCSHYLGRFVGGQVAVTAVAEGPRSPYLEDMVPGFDEGAHATALGKALLATLTTEQRFRYLREYGMRPFTTATLTSPEAFEADLAAGDRRGHAAGAGAVPAGGGLRRGAGHPGQGHGTPGGAGLRVAGQRDDDLGPGGTGQAAHRRPRRRRRHRRRRLTATDEGPLPDRVGEGPRGRSGGGPTWARRVSCRSGRRRAAR